MTTLGRRALQNLQALVSEPGPGDVLAGRFELGEVLGEGAMGVVFAAQDRDAGREVAVKVLRASGGADAARFEREISALSRAHHSALVPCLAHGEHGGARYLVMDRLRGCTLAERLRTGRLSVGEAARIGHRLAGGLAALHAQGVAHRDVKPSNIFLVERAAAGARLLDFGLARGATDQALTGAGALVGTPGYMAPEQVRAAGDAAGPADVFALGCVLFEGLTGRAAFSGATTEVVLTRILLEAPPRVTELRPDTPAAFAALVGRMLSQDPAARPGAAEVAGALEAIEPSPDFATTEVASPAGAPSKGRAAGDGIPEIVAHKYKVLSRIGEGGMGVVVAARHLELGTRVALKMLRAGPGYDEGRFVREAQAAARLESEHVARVLDVGKLEDGTPYIVMEHLQGVDLARRLEADGPLGVADAVGFVLQACEAIAEAHALGIIHRDLKPANLFLAKRRDGSAIVKVLDFGISKLTRPLQDATGGDPVLTDGGAAVPHTGARMVLGSAAYMSPEQLRGSGEVDARTDQWALGVVLYELLSGARPFDGESAVAIGARIATSQPASLRERVKEIPAGLERVVFRCLQKEPADRFADLLDLARELVPFCETGGPSVERIARVLARSSPAASVGKTARPPTSPAAPRTLTRGVLTLGVAAAAVGLGVTLMMARQPTDTPSTRPDPAPPATVRAAAAVTTTPPATPQPVSAATVAAVPALEPTGADAAVANATPVPRPSPAPSASTKHTAPAAAPAGAGRTGHDVNLLDPALAGR